MTRWSLEPQQTKEKPPEQVDNIPVVCPVCGVHTNAGVLYRFLTHNNRFINLPISDMAIYNYLLRCTQCRSAILLMWSYGKLDLGAQGAYSFTAGRRVYPIPETSFEINTLPDEYIPAGILDNLKQAEVCHHAGAYYGAGLLLRTACRSTCDDLRLPESPDGPAARIIGLAETGAINKRLAEMTHSVRVIGKDFEQCDPHKINAVTAQDIQIAFEFTLQLVRSIYVDTAKAKKLKKELKKELEKVR